MALMSRSTALVFGVRAIVHFVSVVLYRLRYMYMYVLYVLAIIKTFVKCTFR